jgi:thiosulfate dehydrogenase
MSEKNPIVKSVSYVIVCSCSVLVLVLYSIFFVLHPTFFISKKNNERWFAPDTLLIPKNEEGKLISYGRELIKHTSIYLGPKGKVMHTSNGMNCQNCHLEAGTKFFGNNYSAVAANYPKFRDRSGTVESIEKRVNDCIERSLNGVAIGNESKEMKAFVAYIKWVGKDVEKNITPQGAGMWQLPYLDRAADSVKGKAIFKKSCERCHGEDAKGELAENGVEWKYPPLCGENSFNIGAGLFRLSRMAGYVKMNMPNDLATFEKPVLTDEDAWDVCAYIISLPRPSKNISKDWPDISKKPKDHPFGPFADIFSEAQHKYGPFKTMKSSKSK